MLKRWLPWLLFALLALPVADLVSLGWLLKVYGGWVLVWILLAAVAGIFILKTWRLAAAWALVGDLRAGQLPLGRIFWLGRTLLAAVLFIFPGVVSDLVGLILILPWPGHRANYAPPPKDAILEGEFQRIPPATPVLPPQPPDVEPPLK